MCKARSDVGAMTGATYLKVLLPNGGSAAGSWLSAGWSTPTGCPVWCRFPATG